MKFISRACGVFALAMLAACAAPEAEQIDDDNAALDVDLVGDHGPGWDAQEPAPDLSQARRQLEEVSARAPYKKVLSFTWFGQPNGYWCGPGSTRMALSALMAEPPPQTELARFMGTTTDGTARAEVVKALNHWLAPPVPYVSTPVKDPASQEERDLLKKTLLERIESGYPIVANVLSGWRPPGYPSGRIGHFVAVVGYDEGGEKVLIADPAAEGSAGPRWKNVPRTYWISLHNLGTWVGARGYTR